MKKIIIIGSTSGIGRELSRIFAINNKKRRAYITRRWWLIAKLMKLMPYTFYKKFA